MASRTKMRLKTSILLFFCAIAVFSTLTAQKKGYVNEAHSEIYFGDPIPNLPAPQALEFEQGFQLFIKVWTASEGLGPLFNAQSCANCHHIPVAGGTEFAPNTFVAHSSLVTDSTGNHSFQRFALTADGVVTRTLPEKFTLRKTQSLYGLGLLEAVAVEDLQKLADPDDKNNDLISGRLPRLKNGFGRFGWKSQASTIDGFVRMALITELGLTNREISDDKVQSIASFIKLLALPPRRQIDAGMEGGNIIFEKIGCAKCHQPELKVNNFKVSSLNGNSIYPYTDLLLHDMSKTFDDGIESEVVSASEFRTPALWGLSSAGPPYLHDGRAKSIEEAIILHNGESKTASDNFCALSSEDLKKLLEFLRSL
jgi:CxxC motif-containing protein (DUF1111 family)